MKRNPRGERATTPEDPMLLAAVDMARRTGALEFSLRYQDDEQPTVWIALARHRIDLNGRPVPEDGKGLDHWECAAGLTATRAVLRLCETLIDGGECAHCHRPAGFSEDIDAMPMDDMLCWTQWDPELQTFRRGCE